MLHHESYEQVKGWKDGQIRQYIGHFRKLNVFHDDVMKKVFSIALNHITTRFGDPPCDFSWFLMGSAGRSEQAMISDQDHGLFYEQKSPENQQYFIALGAEISKGLDLVGYPFCEGKIMASNSLWCQDNISWQNQINAWVTTSDWESIRYLTIFYDARVLYGSDNWLRQMKQNITTAFHHHEALPSRFLDNIQFIKKAVGPFGQLFTETHGKHVGTLNLKQTSILPYVNAIRLLAIKEGIVASATIERIERLQSKSTYSFDLNPFKNNYEHLLAYQLSFTESVEKYEDVHFYPMKKISKKDRKEIKKIIRDGMKLHHFVESQIKDRGS